MKTEGAGFVFEPEPGVTTTVSIGAGLCHTLGERLGAIAPGRWFVVTSAAVMEKLGPVWSQGAASPIDPEPLLVPDGEKAKTWSVLGTLLLQLKDRGLRRDGGLVAFGGGTVGDVTGMAASLAMRGVPVVQVPTTLLAAADSALGGKTAVDHGRAKNFAGTFHHPSLVLVDTENLRTLSPRDYRSGLAEIIKSALLDEAFYEKFGGLANALGERDFEALTGAIFLSLKMKASFVTKDAREVCGIRYGLNLGHTVGHALEAASRFRLKHGEAVAWGLFVTLALSEERAGLAPDVSQAAQRWLELLVSPPRLTYGILKGWREYLPYDKKADQAGLRAVLLKRPGVFILDRLATEDWQQALTRVLGLYNRS